MKNELEEKLPELKDIAEDESHTFDKQQELSHSRLYSDRNNEEQEAIETENLPNNEDIDRPVVEIFVKAGCDKKKNGNCPICHRYFMAFYLLREEGQIDLIITTFLPRDPPLEVKSISSGKQYPIVKVHSGRTLSGEDISNLVCDNTDEIDALIDKFDSLLMPTTNLRRKLTDNQHASLSDKEKKAEYSFQNLYISFNIFLKDKTNNCTKLLSSLKTLNDYLINKDTKFLIMDNLAKADCYLLPILQHIKVAGKLYKDFVIPTEFSAIWHYLRDAYETDAFRESCPADREIVVLYMEKASCRPNISAKHPELMDEIRDFSLPNLDEN